MPEELNLPDYITFKYNRFIMTRVEYLIFTQNEQEAKALRIIEYCIALERARLYREAKAQTAPGQPVPLPELIWVAISHRFFLSQLQGTVQSEGTLKEALSNLEAKHLIFRLPGDGGPYDPPYYTLNKPFITYLMTLLPPSLDTVDMMALMHQSRKNNNKAGDQKLTPSKIDPLREKIRGVIFDPPDPQFLTPQGENNSPPAQQRGGQKLPPKIYKEIPEESLKEKGGDAALADHPALSTLFTQEEIFTAFFTFLQEKGYRILAPPSTDEIQCPGENETHSHMDAPFWKPGAVVDLEPSLARTLSGDTVQDEGGEVIPPFSARGAETGQSGRRDGEMEAAIDSSLPPTETALESHQSAKTVDTSAGVEEMLAPASYSQGLFPPAASERTPAPPPAPTRPARPKNGKQGKGDPPPAPAKLEPLFSTPEAEALWNRWTRVFKHPMVPSKTDIKYANLFIQGGVDPTLEQMRAVRRWLYKTNSNWYGTNGTTGGRITLKDIYDNWSGYISSLESADEPPDPPPVEESPEEVQERNERNRQQLEKLRAMQARKHAQQERKGA